MLRSLDYLIFSGIVNSRSLITFDDSIWKAVQDYGTLTSTNAKEIHLIDLTTKINPLHDLLAANNGSKSRQEFENEWIERFDFNDFEADNSISFSKYSSKYNLKAKRIMEKIQTKFDNLKDLRGTLLAMEEANVSVDWEVS